MMKKRILLYIFLVSILCAAVYAQDAPVQISAEYPVEAYFFYGQGCPHCSKMEPFLEELVEEYPLTVKSYEVYFDKDNRKLFEQMSRAFGQEIGGVPTLFINDKVIVGFSDAIASTIEDSVKDCVETGCASPGERLHAVEVTTVTTESSPVEEPGKTEIKKQLTLPAVIGAAAVDAINPCAFAVLIILMTTILASGKKRRALLSGLAFSLSIYISYFLMGLGLYSAVQASGVTHWFYAVVATLAIIIGLFNLKDYFWYGKWFVMEVPLKWRPSLKRLIKGVTSVPGAFLIGFVVSLFLLPCTSGPYIVILGLLAQTTTREYAMALLLLYNLVFILPMLVITGAVAFGFTTTEKAEEWRQRKLKVLHLIAGLILLLLGIGMFIAMGLGMV